MASGTVTYKSDMMFPHREIYNGASAQTWTMHLDSGSFPATSYKITSATLKIDIRNAYKADRHMVVTRDGGEQLGDVSTGKTGVQELPLLTAANYANIQNIKTDGVEYWACQLRGGSFIYIIVNWEETDPEESKGSKETEKLVITGVESSGEKGRTLRTEVSVAFDGVDISEPINQDLITMSYTDNEEDEADDLQIKLQDRSKIWLGKWLNDTMQAAAYGIKQGTKGLTITAGIKQMRPSGKVISADFGSFELDQLKAAGPPSQIQIKGTSLPYSNGVRTEERDKSWEGYTLKSIGQEIATNAGLGFIYDCPDDPNYARVEQAKQTDIAFLQQLCHDNGKSLKISGFKLIIFDQARYESLEAVTTIRWEDGTYTKYNLDTQDGDTHYDQCTVSYYDASNGVKYEATVNADDYDAEAKEWTVCTVTNRKVGSVAEAADLAAKILRLHNKYEKKVDFTLIGNPMLGAGLTVTLDGFGLWDEKYIIKTCKHDISNSGYTTKITLRTIPEGQVTVVKAVEEEDESASKNTQKKQQKKTSWYTTSIVKVYDDKDGNSTPGHTTMMNKDVKVKVLGSTKGEYTLVQYGEIQGYVKTSELEKREDKKDNKKNDKK